MKTKLLASVIALMAVPAFAQMSTHMTDVTTFDTDADGMISEAEFNTGFTGAGTMGRFDADGDMMLSEQEYTEGFGDIGDFREEGYQARAFGDLDADADGFLNEEEYNASFFSDYDRDQSGALEEAEFEGINTDMDSEGLLGRRIDG